eukprot:RCo004777
MVLQERAEVLVFLGPLTPLARFEPYLSFLSRPPVRVGGREASFGAENFIFISVLVSERGLQCRPLVRFEVRNHGTGGGLGLVWFPAFFLRFLALVPGDLCVVESLMS